MGRTKQAVKTQYRVTGLHPTGETNATTIKLDGSEKYTTVHFNKGYQPVENPWSLLFLKIWNKANKV